MIKKPLIILMLALAAAMATAFAAPALDMPVKKVHGQDYYYHVVKSGETIYGISKRFGLTRDEIVRYNPGVADGLRSGSTIYFPVSDYGKPTGRAVAEAETEAETAAPAGMTAHVVEKGETLFGISHRYGVSPEDIVAVNKGADTGIKSGQTLYIPTGETTAADVAATQPADATPEAADADVYTVREGDTFFSIARGNGMSFDRLLQLNPGVDPDRIYAGLQLRLSDSAPVIMSEPLKNLAPVDGGITQVDVVEIADTADAGVTPVIAVVLPFMLDEATPSRQAQLFTDFFKGLMLAADTLSQSGSPVAIRVYDTAGSTERLGHLISSGVLDSVSVIIAPEDESQLAMLANYVDNHPARLFNIFNIKNEDHLTNTSVYQANISHDLMYDKAIGAILERFDGFTPVILRDESGRNEKAEFTAALTKTYVEERGIDPVEVVYSGMLRSSDLTGLSADSAYVFIPSSGTVGEFNKFARAFKTFKDASADPSRVMLFGYPDWTAFRNDALATLHSLDAVIYSRFFADSTSPATRGVTDAFSRWYGKPMMESVPSYALLGYDTGIYLIRNLRSGHDGTFRADFPAWKGVQSAFDFADGDSRINETLYIVRFMPENFVDVKVY